MVLENNNQGRRHGIAPRAAAVRHWRHSEDGASLVEFALTLPAFLLVITGILWFSVVMFENVALSEAAEVATRQLVASRGQTTDPCATIANAVYNSASSFNHAQLTFTLKLNGTSYSGTSCASASANMVLGGVAQVNVTYPAKLLLSGDSISAGFLLNAQEQDKIQ